jgi:fructokinase
VFGVILGTGVGGGLVLDGDLRTGRNAIAGEWGHLELPGRDLAEPLPDIACWCGRRRCVEAFCSGPALAADHLRVAGESGLDAAAIAARATTGEAGARATLERHADRLASALSVVVDVVDPDVVVLGGGVSNLAGLAERVQALLPSRVFADVCTTAVVRHRLGDAAGARGAAWL